MSVLLLTEQEHGAMALTAELANAVGRIVGNGQTRSDDLGELIGIHLHAIQCAILAQAAARAYPDRYRLLGETVNP